MLTIEEILVKLYNSAITYTKEISEITEFNQTPQVKQEVISKKEEESFEKPEIKEEKQNRPQLSDEEIRNKKLQLVYIMKNLQNVHKTNLKYQNYFLYTQNLLLQNNIVDAASCLQKVLYDENLDDEMKRLHNYIIQEARKINYDGNI